MIYCAKIDGKLYVGLDKCVDVCADSDCLKVQRESAVAIKQLQTAKDTCEVERAKLQDALQQTQQQLEAAQQQAAAAASTAPALPPHRSNSIFEASGIHLTRTDAGLIHSSRTVSNASSAHGVETHSRSRSLRTASNASESRWQEQNGGGSLHGVGDGAVASGKARETLSGVDVVYLRNVVFKFLEAVVAGKAAERDALLPAIAAVLQASPAEYSAMCKVLAASALPSSQVKSMLSRFIPMSSS